MVSLDSIRQDAALPALPAVYLWHGPDRRAILLARDLLRARFQSADPSGANVETFGGKDYTPEDVVAAARTSAFFSGRLIIADDLPYFGGKSGKPPAGAKETAETSAPTKKSVATKKSAAGKRAESDDVLLSYCQNPNPDNCLVLIAGTVNKGRRLYKEIAQNGKIVEFALPQGDGGWTAWIRREAEARDQEMPVAAAAFLLNWTGHDTSLLAQELDKLALFSAGGGAVGPEDIRAVCIPRPETTVFALLDDWAAGRRGAALRKLDAVLEQNYYLQVFTMFVRQIRLLLAAALARRGGGGVKEFMLAADVKSPYEGSKIFRQSERFTEARLTELMGECLRMDVAMKSGGGDPRLLLEMLLLR
jgi:DNA polymerase-3 subunit delta